VSRSATITVELPLALLEDLEDEARRSGTNRSELVQQAIKALLEEHAEARYTEGYRRFPETDEEHEWAEASMAALEDNPW
jgi:metal-responsive CopG/Arc/MetJ family transcriptional regulator